MEIDVNKLDKICECAGKSAIYEDGDYWVATDADGKNPKKVLKTKIPYWPLSAVLKYNATPINMKRLEGLNEELGRGLKAEND